MTLTLAARGGAVCWGTVEGHGFEAH